MNKKKIYFGVVILVCFCAVIFTVYLTQGNHEKDKFSEKTEVVNNDNSKNDNDDNRKSTENAKNDSQNTAQKEEESTNTSDNNVAGEQDRNVDSNDEKKNDTTVESTKADEITQVENISFPYQIPNTDIVIETMSGYKGIYLEDGSDESVKKVATILVKNNSKRVLEYGTISLQAGDKILEFTLSALPAGKLCVVMEKNKISYSSKWKIRYKESSFAYTDDLSKLESEVDLKVETNNGITITNKTSSVIPRIRIFYKYQLGSGEYIGGITYTCKVDDLEPGESRAIYPSHFSSEGSVVMMIRRYESKDSE